MYCLLFGTVSFSTNKKQNQTLLFFQLTLATAIPCCPVSGRSSGVDIWSEQAQSLLHYMNLRTILRIVLYVTYMIQDAMHNMSAKVLKV